METSALKRTDTLVQLISQDIESDFRAVDQTLLGIADELISPHAPQGAELDQWLRRLSTHHPMVNILGIADAEGNIRYNTGAAPGPRVNIANRSYFTRLRDDPSAGLQVSEPLVGRTTGKTVIVLARRLQSDSGKFIGIAFGGITTAHFADKLALLNIASRDGIYFLNADRRIVVRYPELASQSSGAEFNSASFNAAVTANPERGHFNSGVTDPDAIDRMYSYVRNPEYGFYVNAGLARVNVFAAWRLRSGVIAVIVLLFALVSSLMALKLRRVWLEQINTHIRLAEQEARLTDSQQIARLGHFTFDLRHQRWEASATLEGIFGIDADFPRNEVGWQRLVHPDDAAAVLGHIRTEGIEQKSEFDFKFRIVRPTGVVRWVHARGRMERRGSANTPVIFGSLQDITEERNRQIALNKLNDLLDTASRMARFGGWSLEIPSMQLSWTDGCYRLHDVAPGTPMTLEQAIDFYTPSARPLIAAAAQAGIAEGKSWDLELELVSATGRPFWARVFGQAEKVAGETVRLYGAILDISEQRKVIADLAASQARFQAFFDSAMVGMAVTSLEKGWMMVNPALSEILGYPKDVLVTKSWAELTHPDDLAADEAEFNRVLAGEIDGYSMEKRFVRSDGQVVDAFIAARAVRNAEGKIDFFSASVQDISRRKAAERGQLDALENQKQVAQRLLESERRIRLLARHAAAYIYELECDGTIRFVNRVYHGLSEDQVLGTKITDWFPVELRLTFYTALECTIANRREETLEYEIPDPAGVLRSYETRLTPVLVDDVVRSVVLTANEITERKQFERQLFNSRELLRQFFDHFPGTAYVKDERLRVLMASSGFKQLLRLEPAAMIGQTNEDLFPDKFSEKMSADDRRVMASGVTEVFEEEFAGRYYESTKFVIEQAEKKLLGGFTVDVTHRFRNRQRAEAMLGLAILGGTVPEREFLRTGLQQAETITGSAIGFLHFVNEDQETIELVTWTDGALKGCQASYDSHYPISKAGIWANCFHERAPVVFNDYAAEMEKKGLPPGHAKLDRLISVPVIEQGMVRMMIGVGNRSSDYDDFDIQSVQLIGNDLWRVVRRQRAEQSVKEKLDELTRLNQQLSQAQNQLLQSEKMATIGQLAAGVAHELNNPIGFIQSNLGTLDGYIEDLLTIIDHAADCSQSCAMPNRPDQFKALLAEKDINFLRQDVRDLLAESKDGADRVRRIVQNLKDFSHVSEDDWVWSDLHRGLESTLRLVWNEIKYKAEVEKQFGVLPEVFCVASQLNQVFMNLLVNAAQAIEAKGKITLRTGVENDPRGDTAEPSSVWIEIQDSGKGIPAENLQRVFDPFFTTKPVGQGTGLGLSLAWSIVQKHHGTFTVDSKVGVGTTFRITLPINGRGGSEGVVRDE